MKAYTAVVMDMDRFRKVLCENREKYAGSQADLSALTKTDANPIPVNAMTISAIERGAQANPSLHTVIRLVEAMGLTLSSFFAQIEGLPTDTASGHDHALPPSPPSPPDETVPTLTADEINTIRALTKVIRTSADREHDASERYSRAHRRYAPEARAQQTAPPAASRGDRAGAPRRRRLKKKTKKKKDAP